MFKRPKDKRRDHFYEKEEKQREEDMERLKMDVVGDCLTDRPPSPRVAEPTFSCTQILWV